MTDTPIYDDTLAWQRKKQWDQMMDPTARIIPVEHLPHRQDRHGMSKRDVQLLFWSMIIAGFFGVILALALNGWFD